ncbi:hypothetical protein [Deinococcus arenicola]|uniref:HIG1 domain-containing protein n=1 Tax=Deinococcus arenicola TaxID=2994950 RepID=A0ABU4DRU6_9DEIO|nr:hypothetical protein [Deinococcus sp. ZS9-10]MDV6374692.1 hypothetical protein [Deinococcus sp. ZS9-10]
MALWLFCVFILLSATLILLLTLVGPLKNTQNSGTLRTVAFVQFAAAALLAAARLTGAA